MGPTSLARPILVCCVARGRRHYRCWSCIWFGLEWRLTLIAMACTPLTLRASYLNLMFVRRMHPLPRIVYYKKHGEAGVGTSCSSVVGPQPSRWHCHIGVVGLLGHRPSRSTSSKWLCGGLRRTRKSMVNSIAIYRLYGVATSPIANLIKWLVIHVMSLMCGPPSLTRMLEPIQLTVNLQPALFLPPPTKQKFDVISCIARLYRPIILIHSIYRNNNTCISPLQHCRRKGERCLEPCSNSWKERGERKAGTEMNIVK